MSTVAIVSCEELVSAASAAGKYGAEGLDDRFLYEALNKCGIRFDVTVWSRCQHPPPFHRMAVIRTAWDYAASRTACFQFMNFCFGLEKAGTLLLNSWRLMRWNCDKRYILQLSAAGIRTVPTLLLEGTPSSSGLLNMLALARGWTDVIVKPSISSGSRNTARFDIADASQLAAAQRLIDEILSDAAMDHLAVPAAVLIQPFIPSVSTHGEVSVVCIEGRICHAVCKKPRPNDFRSQSEFGSDVVLHHLSDEERKYVGAVLGACVQQAGVHTREMLIARIDFVRAPETGPGSVEPLATTSTLGATESDCCAITNTSTECTCDSICPAHMHAGGEPFLLMEAETIEPSCFFRYHPETAEVLAAAVKARLSDVSDQ